MKARDDDVERGTAGLTSVMAPSGSGLLATGRAPARECREGSARAKARDPARLGNEGLRRTRLTRCPAPLSSEGDALFQKSQSLSTRVAGDYARNTVKD